MDFAEEDLSLHHQPLAIVLSRKFTVGAHIHEIYRRFKHEWIADTI